MPNAQLPRTPAAFGAFLNDTASARRSPVDGLAGKLLLLHRLRDLYRAASKADGKPVMDSLLEELQIGVHVEPSDLAHIPAVGAVVAVANHPFGMLEGAILGTLLPRVRPDVKIMVNYLLAGLPKLDPQFIFVDPFAERRSTEGNARALRQAVSWLKAGGMLVTFPAGEVSHWSFRHGEVADPPWSETIARLIRITRAAALPIFFEGRNSVGFHLAGMIHPGLRTASLPHELLNKTGRSVEVRIGAPIPSRTICSIAGERDATHYLRWRTYLLRSRGRQEVRAVPRLLHSLLPRKVPEPLAVETPREAILAEVNDLPPDRRLAQDREFSVFLAEASRIPNLLKEVGRLRELSFRQVGEGTGRPRDLDNFDAWYRHLFLWNESKQELVGAYRMGSTRRILLEHGIEGLYTSTLFHYNMEFFRRIGPALELGRSFIRPEYQKQYAPLLLLWKAICRYVSDHPEIAVVFGPVSVSNRYNPVSRRLIAEFFRSQAGDRDLARLVKPHSPLRRGKIGSLDFRAIGGLFQSLDSLSAPIADIEPDGKGIPILLKQYVRFGGKLLGFNVDRNFANALDGLVVVDLRCTDPAILERYMTKERAATFLRYHSAHGNGGNEPAVTAA
jgi:putative hemolysin